MNAKLKGRWIISVVHTEYVDGGGSQWYQVRPLSKTKFTVLDTTEVKSIDPYYVDIFICI